MFIIAHNNDDNSDDDNKNNTIHNKINNNANHNSNIRRPNHSLSICTICKHQQIDPISMGHCFHNKIQQLVVNYREFEEINYHLNQP